MSEQSCSIHGREAEDCDCSAAEVTFAPTVSNPATDVQAAIENATGEGVASFNARTGVVVPAQADYDAFFLTQAEGDARYLQSSGFAIPAIVLGTAAAAGAATTAIRSDATILAFDATTPSTQAIGDTGTVGVATVAARRDHKHVMPTFAVPAVVLGTAAAAGAAATLLRSDATILAFDTTVPTTIAVADAAAAGSAAVAARRDHRHGMFAQIAGATDVLAGLVTQGLRAASSNPPLNLGTGAITAGPSSFSGSTTPISMINNGQCRFTATSTDAQAAAVAAVAEASGSGYLWSITDVKNSVRDFGKLANGNLFIADNEYVEFGTANGSTLAPAANQKIGFHTASPTTQRASAAQAAVVTTGATNVTPFGFTTAAQADAIVTLVNELRAALVNKGLIKGSA